MAELMSRTPPALAVRLLRICLGVEAREVIAGDLDEQFARGRSAWWYWRHALTSIGAYWLGRAPAAAETMASSFRQLTRQKRYVAAAAGTLALAVATATASAVVVNRAFIDALPYPNGHRLVVLATDGFTSISASVYNDLRNSTPPFDAFAPTRNATVALATDDTTTTVNGSMVTREYFDLLGVQPVMGAIWSSQAEPVVVVSWAFFQQTLRADSAAIGRMLTIDGTPRRVAAVLPPQFLPPFSTQQEIWLPLDLAAAAAEPRARRQLTTLARRSEATTPEDVAAFLAMFSKRMQSSFPVEHGRQTWQARSLQDDMIGTAGPALVGVAAAAALLLVIVCANVGGLATARAVAMQQQIAVRQAIGASRGRLFVEQLADAVLIAAAGTAAGLVLAPALVAVAARYQREFLDRLQAFQLDTTVTLVAAIAGLTIGTLSAFIPARLIASGSLAGLTRGTRGATASRRLTFARQALIVAQVALALVLVIGAGLLVRTVRHLTERPLGFSTAGMTTMSVTLPGKAFASQAAQMQFEEDLLATLGRLPGVDAATASVGLPASRAMGASLHIHGRPVDGGLPEVGYNSIAPGFLNMMGMPLLAGRDVNEHDRQGTTGAILVNSMMAKQYWPGGDAIGARIYLGPGRPDPGAWMEVVGIVADVRPYAAAEPVTPSAYGSTRQYSWPRRFFTVHTHHKPSTLEAEMRTAVRAANPAVSVGIVRDLPAIAEAARGRHRLVMSTLVIFSGVALALCASGLYAVAAMMSSMRRREYAIRLALGAPREHVRWQVVRQSLTLAGAGVGLGLGLAAAAVGAIQGLLHGVGSTDPSTFAGAAVVLTLVAAGAAWGPARSAAHADPIETLRAE